MFRDPMICAIIFFVLSACGKKEFNDKNSEVSQTKSNINVPRSYASAAELKNIGFGIRNSFHDGLNRITIKDLALAMKLEGNIASIIPGIVAAHPNLLDVRCQGQFCQGFSDGEAYSFVLDWIDLPLLGKPTMTIAPRLEMEIKISDDGQKLEICRIVGLSTRAGFLSGPIDGTRFEVKDDAITDLMFDLGRGGSYPNDGCRGNL